MRLYTSMIEWGGALDDLIGHSITYRIAVGPRAGQNRPTSRLPLARGS